VKFCQPHWEKLRQAIKDRGLWSFVATSGENAAAKLVASTNQGTRASNFDPLMSAHNAIVANVMDNTPVGMALFSPNEDGSERCPICFVQADHDANCTLTGCVPFETWIDRAADDARDDAKGLGLMPSV
jgi:hypothetical protein